MFAFIAGGLFVGPLGQILGNSPILHIVRLIPSCYLAERVVNASQNLGSVGSNLLDTGVLVSSSIILLAITAWS